MSLFKTHKYYMINRDTFNEKEFFRDVHYFEIYDETKFYNTKNFVENYGKGDIIYCFQLWTLWHNQDDKMCYVIATEILTMEDKLLLEPYCTCEYCCASIFRKYTMNPTYCGCIKYDNNPSQKYIDYAKNEFANKKDNYFVNFIKKYLFMA